VSSIGLAPIRGLPERRNGVGALLGRARVSLCADVSARGCVCGEMQCAAGAGAPIHNGTMGEREFGEDSETTFVGNLEASKQSTTVGRARVAEPVESSLFSLTMGPPPNLISDGDRRMIGGGRGATPRAPPDRRESGAPITSRSRSVDYSYESPTRDLNTRSVFTRTL